MSKEVALSLLRTALNDGNAEFRDGQWEAIEKLTVQKQKLLVLERTGWGKSSVYFFTIAAALLKENGSGPVYPVALTSTSVSD